MPNPIHAKLLPRTSLAAAALGMGVLASAPPVAAKVVAASAGGFKLVQEAQVNAKPAAVWQALMHIEKWWISDHTWSGDAKNLKLDPVAEGCWCETWSGGSVKHLTVIYVSDGKEIRFSGVLGPMQRQGVAGAFVWQVEPAGDGTKVTWTYTVGGYSDPPLDQLAAVVDEVQSEQIASLKKYAETAR